MMEDAQRSYYSQLDQEYEMQQTDEKCETVFATQGEQEAKPKIDDTHKSIRASPIMSTKDVEWNITTPNIKAPHDEWAINAKELELLMTKSQFFELAKQIFQDPALWETKSWQQEKFTASKITHPLAASAWQARYKVHLPGKEKTKVSIVYNPFIRLLIAEFVLQWKVDYSWKNEASNDLPLKIHPLVLAISNSRKDIQVTATINKGKRKMEDVRKSDARRDDHSPIIRPFLVKKEHESRPNNVKVFASTGKTLPKVVDSAAPSKNDGPNSANTDFLDMQSVCARLRSEVGNFIETSLCSKYNVQLCH